MPRRRGNSAAAKPVEPVRAPEPVEPVKPEEKLQLYDDQEDVIEEEEEEVEYEEIEEEVEEVEEDEEEEEEEEEVVEEVEEEEEEEEEEEDPEEETPVANGANASCKGDEINAADEENEESKKHAELLALPPHGSEVYVGGVPSDASDKDLKRFCESVGEVVEVRMMKGRDSSDSKSSYAFVTFKTKELASKAIKNLNNSELKGKKVKVSASQAKHKLFIGDVPRHWTQDDIKKAVEKVGPGVIKIDLMKDPQTNRNRGFGFVEYYNHACADYARQKMSTPKFKLDTIAPTVSWADPKSGESASSSQVKALYVKNLPKGVTQDQLKKLFEHHGDITKVVLPPAKAGHSNRYGFVHFKERSMAMKALKNTERYELDGQLLDCSLAKPPADKKDDFGSTAKGGPLIPSYPPVGYNLMAGHYGALPAGFAQPMVYGAGAPAGVAMVPMILPDGRLGYVVQQPGQHVVQQQQGGRQGAAAGASSSGRRQKGDSSRGGGGRYRPY